MDRWELIALAAIGVVLAIVAITWTGPTLLTVGFIFGIYLVAAGLYRASAAVLREGMNTGMRWLSGILGLLLLAGGVLLIANPFDSLIVLAYVIGIGWIIEGIIDIAAGVTNAVSPRWLALVSGAVSILAGIATFVLPVLAIAVFLVVAAILLIAVSVSTLLILPRGTAARGRGDRPEQLSGSAP